MLATGAAVTVGFENRYRCHDGSYRWLSWNATPTATGDKIYAVARDITERHDLDATQGRLAAIVESTADAVVAKGLDGTILSWNPAAERIYGYPADEAIGRRIDMLFPPELRSELSTSLTSIARGETIKYHETTRLRKDGKLIHVGITISPIRDSSGTIVAAASIARDVSDARMAEARFRRLVQNAPDAMIITAADGTIQLANEQAERLFGYEADALLGQPVEILVPNAVRGRHLQHRETYTVHPEMRIMGTGLELHGLRRDGTTFPAEVSLAPLDTDEGILVSAAIRDITERKNIEQTLAAARDEALAASEIKSQFVAMVSHEIRTPMNGVIGLTRLLLKTPLQPTQRRYGEAIHTSARALLTIINDILDFSKIEAGKIVLAPTDFNVGDLVEQVAQVAAEAARGKGLEVLNYYPPDLPVTVRGDEGRIRQILLNLLSNAVKFTHDGYVLIQATTAEPDDHGRIRLQFSVSDTGVGIDPETVARLFEPFTQADGTTSRQYGGTGLGLTISRQLVELMGGTIEVDSEPGRGSQFTVTTPLDAPQATDRHHRPGRHALTDQHLLIIEDNPTVARMILEHASAWGMRATIATTSRNGLAALRDAARDDQPFDAAVIDQQLPDAHGTEVAEQVLADPSIPTPALLLLTNGSYDDQEEDLLAAGAVDALTKPVGPSALYNWLIAHLDPDAAEARQRGSDDAKTALTNGGHGTVLIAEDNEVNQMVAIDTLADLGYHADIARNGQEAVDMAAAKQYTAILMDCQMPRMDGYEATRAVRRQEAAGHHIPIIAMTAGAMTEDRQRCLDAGMDDYLAKPIDPDELQAALERYRTPTNRQRQPTGTAEDQR